MKQLRRLFAAVRIAARDPRIPRWLRWLAGFGVLPIPGPLDEAILLVVAPILFALYRTPLREAWEQAAAGAPAVPEDETE